MGAIRERDTVAQDPITVIDHTVHQADAIGAQRLVDTEGVADARTPIRTHVWVALMAMIVGAGCFLGGLAGAVYTWDQAADQNITTPDDAFLAEAPVRGPLTMLAQKDIITEHQLNRTDGLYYAEMPRQVAAVDEAGEVILDADGEAVMVANEARATWFNATTLTTALGLGIIAYALAAFAMVIGLTLMTLGWFVKRLGDEVALTT